jgi:anti-anti-sigma factor
MSVLTNSSGQIGTSAERRGMSSVGVMTRLSGNRLDVAGDMDLATMPSVITAVLGCRQDGDLTLDLSRVDFIDAFGLGRLVVLQRAFSAAGRRLCIVGAPPRIHRIFVLGGVADLLEPCSSSSDRSEAS